MPRRNQATIRLLEPDSIYRSRIVQQVINKVMTDGKKSVAEKITYDALAVVGERSGNNPVEELEGAVKQLTPVLEVRSRRVGGATYQVPVEVPARRARTLAVRWLVEFARNRREKSMAQRLPHRPPPPHAPHARGPLAGRVRPQPAREVDGAAARERAARRAVPAGRRVQAQGRHLPHGAGQQGLRALPLVAEAVSGRRPWDRFSACARSP